jgi:hypothetical protein
VYFIFSETAGKTLETELMFEDQNGIQHLGTSVWKTHVKTRERIAMEHGDLEAPTEKATGEEPTASA